VRYLLHYSIGIIVTVGLLAELKKKKKSYCEWSEKKTSSGVQICSLTRFIQIFTCTCINYNEQSTQKYKCT